MPPGTTVANGLGMASKWYAPGREMPAQRGPFRPEHVRDGDRYEISKGHPVYVAPAGRRHGGEHVVGTLAITTDPAVREAGIDVGYALDASTLRAPDIAVGNVGHEPGWAEGAPELAVEYADRGTDEADLQTKIGELLAAGTRWVWVVRLVGPRRVDVHARDQTPRTVPSGGSLEAPGVLTHAVPVDALFDRERASEVALSNLLAKHGLRSLEQVRAAGREDGLREAVGALCDVLAIELDGARHARLANASLAELEALVAHLRASRTWP